MAATPEIAPMSGLKNNVSPNKPATTAVVRPVRPPCATPAADSIYAVDGLVPTREPPIVARESANKAR